MAIRNTSMGGTDWAAGELGLNSVDLNDTFDKAFDYITTLTFFWLNPDLYSVYDDFESYSVGAFTSNAKWTVHSASISGTATATVEVVSSTNAGGSSKELHLSISHGSVTGGGSQDVSAINLTANTHKSVRVAFSGSTTGASGGHSVFGYVSFDKGSNYYRIAGTSSSDDITLSVITNLVFVVAKGSNQYDCYVGGKLMQTVTDATFQMRFRTELGSVSNSAAAVLYIDDVRESVGTV